MELFIDLLKEFPWFANLVVIMGSLRVIFKPLFSLIDAIIESTPNKSDDEAWSKFKQSKTASMLIWLLDYFASVKIKK